MLLERVRPRRGARRWPCRTSPLPPLSLRHVAARPAIARRAQASSSTQAFEPRPLELELVRRRSCLPHVPGQPEQRVPRRRSICLTCPSTTCPTEVGGNHVVLCADGPVHVPPARIPGAVPKAVHLDRLAEPPRHPHRHRAGGWVAVDAEAPASGTHRPGLRPDLVAQRGPLRGPDARPRVVAADARPAAARVQSVSVWARWAVEYRERLLSVRAPARTVEQQPQRRPVAHVLLVALDRGVVDTYDRGRSINCCAVRMLEQTS